MLRSTGTDTDPQEVYTILIEVRNSLRQIASIPMRESWLIVWKLIDSGPALRVWRAEGAEWVQNY